MGSNEKPRSLRVITLRPYWEPILQEGLPKQNPPPKTNMAIMAMVKKNTICEDVSPLKIDNFTIAILVFRVQYIHSFQKSIAASGSLNRW